MSEIAPVMPGWDLAGVQAFTTTRAGGISPPPYAELNLGESTGDHPDNVMANRQRLAALLPAPPRWLRQVHGTRVIHLDDWAPGIQADAAWTDRPDQVAAIVTADCLPVLLAGRNRRVVAAAHAGWRGLAGGVLEAVIDTLPVAPGDLVAWIGPAISAAHYEVGGEVRAAFADHPRLPPGAFRPGREGRYQADLAGIAEAILAAAGIPRVLRSGRCTAGEPEDFFSYRRDGATGRMASVIRLA